MRKARRTIRTLGILTVILSAVILVNDAGAQALSPDIMKAFEFRGSPSRQAAATGHRVPSLNRTPSTRPPHRRPVEVGQQRDHLGVDLRQPTAFALGDLAWRRPTEDIYLGTGEHTTSAAPIPATDVQVGGRRTTWTNIGLKETEHVGRVIVTQEPDIVYVAALGKLYPERGARGVQEHRRREDLTKSLDVKIDGRAIGAADLVMDPVKPEILYAATYDKSASLDVQPGRSGSAIYKTVDAGKTWTKLAGGLPRHAGRIGLDITARTRTSSTQHRERNKPGVSDADRLAELRAGKASDGMLGEQVYRSDDAGRPGGKVSRTTEDRRRAGLLLHADPHRPQRRQPRVRADGRRDGDQGRRQRLASAFRSAATTTPCGSTRRTEAHHPWLRPRDGITYDAGANWYHPDELPLAQFYAIGVDNQVPTTCTAAFRTTGRCAGRPPSAAAARSCSRLADGGRGDGFYNQVDSSNRYLYNESQFGSISRTTSTPARRRASATRPGAPLELELADSHLAPRPQRHLPRREQAPEVRVAG